MIYSAETPHRLAAIRRLALTLAVCLTLAAVAMPLHAQVFPITLASSANPVTLGAPLTLTATVGSHTGTVVFYNGATVLGVSTVSSGSATLSTNALAAGTHVLYARLYGDPGGGTGGSTTLSQRVTAAAGNAFRVGASPATGPLPISIAGGDFNRDGRQDLAVANANGNSVNILLGNGSGGFTAGVTYSVGMQPQGVVAADFDRDGYIDLAVPNYTDNNVSVLLGNGDGTFDTALNYGVGYNAMAAAASDWNLDGKADLVVATYYDVKVLLGNGDGTFQTAVPYAAGNNPRYVVAGHFNSGLEPDLAVANWGSGTVSILAGAGNGTLGTAQNYTVGLNPRSIAIGDFNGDGAVDLAVANFGTNNISVLLAKGDGTFHTAVNYSDGTALMTVATGDFNGDGKLDLAAAGYASTNLTIFLGNGDGTFQAARTHPVGQSPQFVTVGDFNADGYADLAVANGSDNTLSILVGTAITLTATAGTPQTTTAGTAFSSALTVTARDGSSNPVSGIPVGFLAPAPASGATATLSSSTATTDPSGVASITATANNTLGTYQVTASSGSLTAAFDLTNALGAAATITVANTPQATAVGTAFANPLQVTVRDAGGNALGGVTVTYAVPGSGASATLSSLTAITDSSGIASVTATANGASGSYSVGVSAGAANSSFALTNLSVAVVTLTVSPSTASTFGAPVTLRADVTPTSAAGKVTFYDGVTVVGTGTLSSGSSTITTIMLPAGTRKLRAYYRGSASYVTARSNVVSKTISTVSGNMLAGVSKTLTGAWRTIASGDFNGDNKADLVVGGYSGATPTNVVRILSGVGDGTFVDGPTLTVGDMPYAVLVGDFDGDSKLDIATCNGYNSSSSANNVSILLGNGDGTFQSAANYPVGNLPYAIVSADFNNDGVADLATANYSSSDVSVLLGKGDGTFWAAVTYTSVASPYSIAIGDFNSDGTADLAVSNANGSSVAILLGRPNGTFQSALNQTVGYYPYAAVPGDFNGDGKEDLAAAISGSPYSAAVSLGNNDGTFQPSVTYPVRGYPRNIYSSDFNGDGRLDLITTNPNDGSVNVLLGTGTGAFGTAGRYPAGMSAYYGAIADYNGDGRPDIAVTNTANLIGVLLGSTVSLATSGTPQTTVAGTAFPSALRVTVTDSGGNPVAGLPIAFAAPSTGATATLSSTSVTTDSSGVASITATANSTTGNYTVTAATGGLSVSFALTNVLGAATTMVATSGTPQYTRAGSAFRKPLQVKLTDIGGNALGGITVTFTAPATGASATLSASTAATDSSGIATVTATANSTLGTYVVTASANSLSVPFSLGNTAASSIGLTASAGSSVFGSQVTLTATVIPSSATGKVTFYDGVTVLGTSALSSGVATFPTVLLAAGSRTLRAYYLGDGDYAGASSSTITHTVATTAANIFAAATQPAAASNPRSIALGDFNADGRADLAIANYQASGAVSVLLGNGDGTFATPVTYPSGNNTFSVVAGDFNGDGKTDLAAANWSPGSISVFLGNGNGTFQPATSFSTTSSTRQLLVGDFDGDGRADLAAANDASSIGLTVHLGNGDGTFQPALIGPLAANAYALAAGDFNRDGKPDLAVTTSNRVNLFLGNGDGTFQTGTSYSVSSYPDSVKTGNLNGDSYTDLVVATEYNGVSFLAGNGDGTFQAPTLTPVTSYGTCAADVSDFNGDGRLDVAVANFSDRTVRFLTGSGAGTFQTGLTYLTESALYSLAVGDYNGDGRADLVTANSSGAMTILLGASATLAVSGTPQTTVAGTAFPASLQVTIKEGTTPVPGVTVTFAGPSSGANATLSATSVLTNASGVASVTATANTTLGNYTVTATAGPLAGSFLLNNALGAPATLTAINTTQTGGTGTAFAKPLQVTVKDAGGNALSGVTVGFSAPATGASATLSSSTVVTNASGVAFITATANSTLGSYTVTATVGSLTANFSLTNLPASSISLSASTATTTLGSAVTLTATVSPSSAAGKVTFWDGTLMVGAATLSSGSASYTTTLLPAGTRKLKAYYVGDSATAGSSSAVRLVTITTVAGNYFRPATSTPVGSSPLYVVVGDFNKDGKADAAASNADSNSVSILLGQGDGTLQTAGTITVGSDPLRIATADFNADGNTDLAVANRYGSSVSVLLGNGDGTFQTALNLPVGDSVYGLVVADWNGDGKADIAVGSYYVTGTFLGNGDGTFQPIVTRSVPNYSMTALAAGDFNGDSKLDVLLTNGDTGYVLAGNGDGSFQAPAATELSVSMWAASVEDFNGDGLLDIVAPGSSWGVVSALGKGDGTFQTPTTFGTTYTNSAITTSDFDGDGKLDIAVSADAGTIQILLGSGTGVFPSSTVYQRPIYPRGLAAADFNGDGRADLVSSAFNRNDVTVLLGTTATFSISGTPQSTVSGTAFPAPLQVTLRSGSTPISGAVVSFSLPSVGASAALSSTTATTDASGVASVTATANANLGNYTITATSGAFSGSFVLTNALGSAASLTAANSPQSAAVGTSFQKPLQVTVRDAGGHVLSGVTVTFTPPSTGASAVLSSAAAVTSAAGVASVMATANNALGTYSVTASVGSVTTSFLLTNTAASTLALEVSPPLLAHFGSPVTLTAHVTPPTATGKVTFYDGVRVLGTSTLSSGSATLTTRLLPAGKRTVRAYYLGDSAYASSRSFTYTVTVRAVAGTTFRAAPSPSVGSSPQGLALEDLNGDGVGDLVVANSSNSNISILLGNGNGTFQSAVNYSTGYSPYSVAVADVNGDGRNDLLVRSSWSFSILLGNGNGTFQPYTEISSDYTTNFTVGDFNSDGNVDFAYTNYASVKIALGNGDGTFQAFSSMPTAYSASGIATGDFNRDGVTDLAVTTSSDVEVLLGYGNGSFTAATGFGTGYTSNGAIVVEDTDNDLNPDVVRIHPGTGLGTLRGSGDGTLQSSILISNSIAYANALAMGDFNGDAIADVAASNTSYIYTMLGTGTGAFGPCATSNAGSELRGVLVADLNGDGRADIAAANYGANAVAVLLGDAPIAEAIGGTPQTAVVGAAFSTPLTVRVRDGNGNPISGLSVSYSVPGSGAGATLSAATAVTDSSGVATITATANSVAGTYGVIARVTALQLSAGFWLTNTSGVPPTGTPTNFAPSGTASQSSTFGTAVAGLAIDGNTNGTYFSGSVTSTGPGASPWWQVDLNDTRTINSIVIWNRTDCCGDRLGDYWVFISDTPFQASDTPQALQSRTWSVHLSSAPSPSTTIAVGGVPGRYVRVQLAGTNYLSLAEVQVSGLVAAPTGTNLALGKSAAQIAGDGYSPASKAVDGNTNGSYAAGSVTHTASHPNAWWQVDLGAPATIDTIVIWNRTDCCADRMNNYWIFISNTPFSAIDTPATLQTRAGTWSVYRSGAPSPSMTILPADAQGQYVRIQLAGTNYLSLAEVQVFGSFVQTGTNLAAGKTATQTGGAGYALPGNAVDGNTNGQFSAGSVSHTTYAGNAWWQVDLGASAAIDYVRIWNRTDSCGDRLNDYWVFISDTPFNTNDTPATLQNRAGTWSNYQTSAPNPATTVSPQGASGRYVRVQLAGSNFLNLAEVQVFGTFVQQQAANLALGKTATQTGDAGYAPASNAVDGNTNGLFSAGSVSHTTYAANAWWQVDLGAPATITSLEIYNRTDCCTDRLSDYWVFVSNTPFSPTETPATLQNRAGTWRTHLNNTPSSVGIAMPDVQGRYVRVQLGGSNYLNLAEVKVLGSSSVQVGTNLALNKPATQYSGAGYAAASKAVDGNTNGQFSAGSVTHTGFDAHPWWQVDLGASATINSVVIFNRTDCCGERLNDYWVFISDTPFLSTETLSDILARSGTWKSHQSTAPNPSSTISLAGVRGRYVRVQLSGSDYLHLAEVQVVGTIP